MSVSGVGSHYGSIDATPSTSDLNVSIQMTPSQFEYSTRNDNKSTLTQVDKEALKDQQQLPKPAVRQRIQKAVVKVDDMSSFDLDESFAKQATADIGTYQRDGPQRESIEQLSRSPTNSTQNATLVSKGDKGAISLPLPSGLPELRERAYPKKVLFIVANEFCERFSYYGLRTVLVLYFRSVLGFSDASSTVSFHLFATLCYLTPILGAILGDSIWGKFKTILYLSIVYLIGEIFLVLSSIFWDTGSLSQIATFFGLFLIGLGTGGIKPCVSALGGDQFLPHEEKWRQTFFSLFYGAINLGSLISMFLTPMLRSDFQCARRTDCYPYAFGLPCLLMFVSIVVFLMAKDRYNLIPLPERNVILAFCQCIWIALKRKLSGHKLPDTPIDNQIQSVSNNTSSSSLSAGSASDGDLVEKIHSRSALQQTAIKASSAAATAPAEEKRFQRNHWLHLASDRYDTKTIEEFRSVLGIMLLFVPIPVYWCLFDQQGSLWTLQASRMDGRLFNTGFVIQPDQLSVANPLLLLAAIPVFEICIYPALSRYSIMNKPIPRMTVGGLLAALTFVLSSMIELRIQRFLPATELPFGRANLILVNGLSDCSLYKPTISYIAIPGNELAFSSTEKNRNSSFEILEPLNSRSVDLLSANTSFLSNYQLRFKLSSGLTQSQLNQRNNVGCPFSPELEHELNIGPLSDRSIKLLYLEQGNGRLTYKLFNESLELPAANKARVRLLFEFFGSSTQAERKRFSLIRSTSPYINESRLQFRTAVRDGQIFISEFMDIDVSTTGEKFILKTTDDLMNLSIQKILLKPGTRNLIIVHQKDALNIEIKHELLQDNNYRISILYQLAPYLLISISEVMFSITGLEFSYSMAPASMKSVILGAWSLTTAFGNILTVAIESMHLFANVAHDFLFYAVIMALDMVLFAIIGFNYQPYRADVTAQL